MRLFSKIFSCPPTDAVMLYCFIVRASARSVYSIFMMAQCDNCYGRQGREMHVKVVATVMMLFMQSVSAWEEGENIIGRTKTYGTMMKRRICA